MTTIKTRGWSFTRPTASLQLANPRTKIRCSANWRLARAYAQAVVFVMADPLALRLHPVAYWGLSLSVPAKVPFLRRKGTLALNFRRCPEMQFCIRLVPGQWARILVLVVISVVVVALWRAGYPLPGTITLVLGTVPAGAPAAQRLRLGCRRSGQGL